MKSTTARRVLRRAVVPLNHKRQIKNISSGQAIFGDVMKYDDPKMEEYWNTLPADIQALINASGIDICSLGMLTKLGDYYKNDHTRAGSQ